MSMLFPEMDLTNEFRVPLAVDEAWTVLTDIERIAPCMPGATLEGVDGEEYQGTVKVKVGPMTAQYRGVVRFVERDEALYNAMRRRPSPPPSRLTAMAPRCVPSRTSPSPARSPSSAGVSLRT